MVNVNRKPKLIFLIYGRFAGEMKMNMDDSGLWFSEFQYYDSENSKDDQYTNCYMRSEQDMEQKRVKNSNNVSEGSERVVNANR